MKTRRILSGILAMAAAAVILPSCSNEEEQNGIMTPIPTPETTATVDFSSANFSYNEDGVWTKCFDYEPAATIEVEGFIFSHSAGNTVWGEYNYPWWGGFCPSKVSDTTNYSIYDEETGSWNSTGWTSGDWHTWASITGGGVKGKDSQYMVADWNVTPDIAEPLTITCEDEAAFTPAYVYITNSTYGYYGMKYGSNFSKAFGADDWFKLTITGYAKDEPTNSVDFYLAKDGKLVDTWQKVDLSSLGEVTKLVFSLESSDTSEWGMNNPAFFCLDAFTVAI